MKDSVAFVEQQLTKHTFSFSCSDISYADGFEAHWDMFFRKIQNISARVPCKSF